MAKPSNRSYSYYAHQAITLFSGLIREARIQQSLTMQELAERAGISRGLLHRIEKGDLKCEIGAYFEVASILQLQLFGADEATLNQLVQHNQEKLALLPKSIRQPRYEVQDDF